MEDKPIELIYVVDDEPVIASTLSRILQSAGFRAMEFISPEEALKSAATECPTHVITDVHMEGMNGVDLAMRMKSICPACKVLLFAGRPASPQLLAEAAAKGYEFKLHLKPVHPEKLIEEIRRS